MAGPRRRARLHAPRARAGPGRHGRRRGRSGRLTEPAAAPAARLFVALNLPEALRRALHEGTAPLRAAAPRGVSWARAEALHLTLKFLGDVPEDRVPGIEAALRAAAARHLAVRLRVAEVGAFPTLARPRVLWLGVEPSPRLELLHHDVESACAALGFEVEGRPFRPHVTLGRVRADAPAGLGRALMEAAPRCMAEGETLVTTVDLMRSTLSPGGARHDAVARLPLREV